MDTKKLNFISNSNGNNLNNPPHDDLEKVRSLFINIKNKTVYYQEDTVIRELIFLVLRNQNGKTNNNTLFLLVGLKKISKKHLYMEKNTIIHSLLQQTEEPNNVNKCNIVLSDINNKLPKDVSEQLKPETKSNILNQLLANTNKSNFYNTNSQNNSSNNIYTLELDNTYQAISDRKERERNEKEENNKFKLEPSFIDDSQYKSSLKAQYIDNDIQFKNNVKGVTEPTLTQDVDGKKYYFDPLSHTFTPLPKDKELEGVSLEKVEELLVKQNVSPDDINQLKYPGLNIVNSENNENDNESDNESDNKKEKVVVTTTTTTTTSNVDFYDVIQYILMILIIVVLLYSLGSFFFQKKSNKATSPPSNSRTSRPSPSPSSNGNSPFNL
jgi:hypothetical protein